MTGHEARLQVVSSIITYTDRFFCKNRMNVFLLFNPLAPLYVAGIRRRTIRQDTGSGKACDRDSCRPRQRPQGDAELVARNFRRSARRFRPEKDESRSLRAAQALHFKDDEPWRLFFHIEDATGQIAGARPDVQNRTFPFVAELGAESDNFGRAIGPLRRLR
jgi:hypothetical protein